MIKKNEGWTIKELSIMSKRYGYSGKWTSTIRQLINRFGIKSIGTIINPVNKMVTKIYSDKVYEFFEAYFDLELKKKTLYNRIKNYNDMEKELIKEVRNEKNS